MTLLGLVELSHTPNRVAPGPCAQAALAENNVAVNTAVQTIRFLYRIDSVPSNYCVASRNLVSILNAVQRCNVARS